MTGTTTRPLKGFGTERKAKVYAAALQAKHPGSRYELRFRPGRQPWVVVVIAEKAAVSK